MPVLVSTALRCQECGGCNVSLSYSLSSDAVLNGQLRFTDVRVTVYAGCEECSATVLTMPLDELLDQLTHGQA